MTAVELIDFPESLADAVEASLAAAGWPASRKTYPAPIDGNAMAVFVCGEGDRWLETIREIRSMHPGSLLVVVTRLPDHHKWLDALEAGADDYLCLPVEQREVAWLLRKKSAAGGYESGRMT